LWFSDKYVCTCRSYIFQVDLPSSTAGFFGKASTFNAIAPAKGTLLSDAQFNGTIPEKIPAPSSTEAIVVHPQKARLVKGQLKKLGWLDKNHRMIKLTSADQALSDQIPIPAVAIPVTTSGYHKLLQSSEAIDPDLKGLILGYERLELPPSTSKFAAAGNRRK